MKINNIPEYADGYKFTVARIVDSELWFYGAYNDEVKARNVAIEIDGMVIPHDDIEF